MTSGQRIIARSISRPTAGANGYAYGNVWQYHPRSDRHSKIACWAILFDLLSFGGALARHVVEGKIAFGINHRMRDFQHDREKDLDLVVCRRTAVQPVNGIAELRDMVPAYQIDLTDEEMGRLQQLPNVPLTGVHTALVALEAKAAFTEFSKARPRLYDELNSSHLTIHGDTDQAIAAGLAMVNAADTFVSPLRNPWTIGSQPTVVNRHVQPKAAETTLSKVKQLPRRSAAGQRGFDAIGVILLHCRNDGSEVLPVHDQPAPAASDVFHYDSFIERIDTIYAARFSGL